MGNVVKLEIKEKEENMDNNVEYLKLATGGKEPPANGDWLSQLDKGTIFLVQSKTEPRTFTLGEFVLMDKTDRSVIVMSPSQPGQRLWFNPVRFCAQFTLWETLGVMGVTEENEEAEECPTSSETSSPEESEQTTGEQCKPSEPGASNS